MTRRSVLAAVDRRDGWVLDGLVALLARRVRLEVRPCEELVQGAASALCRYDLIFVRSRSERLLRKLAAAERNGVAIVNAPGAIRRARHRATGLALAAAEGVPVARGYQGPLSAMPYARAVIKRAHDDGRSPPRVFDGARGSSRRVYAQELIASAWEHKLFVVGAELFAFVQRPVLAAPDKLATRRRVDADPLLAGRARRTAAALGLEVAGVDFLIDDGEARVTDINPSQGLHTFAEGYPALARHLLERVSP